MNSKIKIPTNFILDLDGVFTDGKFCYNHEGKVYKVFGADDNEALKFLSNFLNINVITADQNGFSISERRIVKDMNLSLDLVSSISRLDWISQRFDLDKTIYMGDGIFDPIVFREVFYSITPSNSLPVIKKYSDFITNSKGGERAVAEACLHILDKFFSIDYELILTKISSNSFPYS